MILDINKQLDEIFKEELLQAEVITTERGKIMRFPNLNVPDVWEVFNKFSIMAAIHIFTMFQIMVVKKLVDV